MQITTTFDSFRTERTLNAASLQSLKEEAISEKTLGRQPLVRNLAAPMGPSDFDMTAEARKIYKFIVGIDQEKPSEMSDEETKQWLQDPFASFLKQSDFPLTLTQIVNSFEKSDSLKKIHSFVVAEGGQIPWDNSTDKVNRTFRLVIVIEMKIGIGPDVLISTGTKVDSDKQFLQVMSWDPINKAYNFYQRLKVFWIWSGNSFHSLVSPSRDSGPFSGHVNGGPVMKELRQPWQHWNSSDATIKTTSLSPSDPFKSSRFFNEKDNADILELFVRSGMHHTNNSRIERVIQNQKISDPQQFLRQILDTDTVNLTSSSTPSNSVKSSSEIILPFPFFANLEALSKTGIEPDIEAVVVPGEIYLNSLKQFNFTLESDDFRLPGDTHFAFLVPEAAVEDIDLLEKMIENGMISRHLAACLLMIDFSNPIYSKSRALLLRYIPSEIMIGNDGKDLDEKFVNNIVKSNEHTKSGTVEEEFFKNWNIPADQWSKEFESRIVKYFEKIKSKVATQDGYNDIVKLAESRRSSFKQTPLFEFDLTFATTNISDDLFPLEITPEGIVRSVDGKLST